MKTSPPEKAKRTTDDAKHVHWNEMNRKQRREMTLKIQNADLSLEVVHPNAAGIDIGNTTTGCCAIRSDRRRKSARCAHIGGSATISYGQLARASSECRRR